jgi:hypothetical protein
MIVCHGLQLPDKMFERKAPPGHECRILVSRVPDMVSDVARCYPRGYDWLIYQYIHLSMLIPFQRIPSF